ncbi:MAG: GNAT family N-acetyltransferase [Aquincola sp.]|nr:GNAT family N-acetyltransferase [Aquincola sp.]MDH4290805.1 GNAT family N-acetyltransferase [Aquincola sp.]MDH5331285.1 GNAT family N-acetyltransferase [Aquincola sp.]
MAALPELTIRDLVDADLPAYKALRDHALAHHEEAFTSDAATEARRTAGSYAGRLGREGDDSFTLGAFRGDRLVGAITCERDPRIKVRHIGHVVGTMVHADEHRRGVGAALLDALIARASADDALQQLTLTVTAGNGAAERLYARAGFVRYGTLSRAIRVGNRFHDKHHMLLTLR